MVKDLVNESALKYILDDIELTCRRIGINATFSIKESKDYKGDAYEEIVSSSFLTMPMLFKEIHVKGNVAAKDSDGVIKVFVNLEYAYKTFDNGYNGFTLGRIVYDVDKSYNGKHPENAHFYIDKVESIKL